MAVAVNEQENPRENLINEMEELVEDLKEHFTNAPFNVKLVYFNDCEDMLSNCILLERDMVGTSHEEAMGDMVSSVRDLVAMLENRIIQECRIRTRRRPRIDISSAQLQFLTRHDFILSDMARLLQCSVCTVQRRLAEIGVTRSRRYSTLSDAEIDEQVAAIQRMHPDSGCRITEGIFRSSGQIIQRRRIRGALHRVDPLGSQRRLTRALHRRVYSVPSPNALWHMDSNHKLIRWRFVIHGLIDGFSRMILHLHVSNNNKADTVLRCFQQSVERYGLPSRVRSDMGGENTLVAQFMLHHPLRGPGCMLTGRSVHNQRIERLWRDVFTECTSYYYSLFYALEDSGLLDQSSEADIFALQFVFMEDIQQQLTQFKDGWNHHKMRTSHNRTPMQQWIMGLQHHSLSNPNDNAVNGLLVDNDYGIDWEGPVCTDGDHTIAVPEFIEELQNPLVTETLKDQLQSVSDDKVIRYILARDITNFLVRNY
uniref:Integrase catalytic domain-containing protein n=1 Tax=Amphimedon queenslandica TaxID=400682 RepID=A0A1X7TUM3_AMPQE